MVDDGQAQHGGVLHGAAHQVGIGDGRAVVAEGDGPGLGELGQLRQLLASAALGDAADG